MKRRALLCAGLASAGWSAVAETAADRLLPRPQPAAGQAEIDTTVRSGRVLQFPRDHGAHTGTRLEWWYITGHLGSEGLSQPTHGFQVTFFRVATGLWPVASGTLAAPQGGRFAARQIMFAHAAVTDLVAGQHRHEQRLQRWNGHDATPSAHASRTDTAVALGGWHLRRDAQLGGYTTRVVSAGLALDVQLSPTQPLLLQGEAGHSRKGPAPDHASHYYSQPQLAVQGTIGGQRMAGRAWLDHEWSNTLLPPDAVGWDWAGINLSDGTALTVFRLRRADGSALWAGGSIRRPGAQTQALGPGDLVWTAGRRWRSPQTGANYPVSWRLDTPLGRLQLDALLDAQELDSRGTVGTVYWEGLSELRDATGQRLGWGYLEMTGYAAQLLL